MLLLYMGAFKYEKATSSQLDGGKKVIYRGPEDQTKDAANCGFGNPPCLGPESQNVGSLYLCLGPFLGYP